jgi:hypothetical protein
MMRRRTMSNTGSLKLVKTAWKLDHGPLRYEYGVFLDLMAPTTDQPGIYSVVEPGSTFTTGQKLYISGIGDVTVTDVYDDKEYFDFEYVE